MIAYQTLHLPNGLQVISHQDKNSFLASVNVLYGVGSRDEDPELTGLAHLFEHLMFGGSAHVENFDKVVQNANGESNAYTTPDLTNYYITLPAQNLETAFWLESDRMFAPLIEKALETQKKVVIEEFKQRYLNQPYGDVWLKLRELTYQVHPYRWATIGKNLEHIEKVGLQDALSFFERFYAPSNAILSVSSPFEAEKIFDLAHKWFEQGPKLPIPPKNYPKEPVQTQQRKLSLSANVPQKAVYIAFHACSVVSEEIFPTLVLNYILSQGKSARLHEHLVKAQRSFLQASMSLSGSKDPGHAVVFGRLAPDFDFEQGYELLFEQLYQCQNITEEEVQKAKNQLSTQTAFADLSAANRASKLAYHAFLGDISQVNQEMEKILAVEPSQVVELAQKLFRPEKASVLFYG
jgi:zinc protease